MFVRPSSISEYLKCPICMDAFHDAMRLFCGHTFCDGCLTDYLKNANTCPECRTKIDKKNIGVDLLAREIINQFEVFCPVEDCPWKGILQEFSSHSNTECKFKSTLPHPKSKKTAVQNKMAWMEVVDDEVLDKINENTAKGSLEARVLAKTGSLREYRQQKQKEEKRNVNSTTTATASKKKQLKKTASGKNNKIEKKECEQSDINFLESLFE